MSDFDRDESDQEFNTYRIFKVQGEITIDDE